MTTNTHQPKLLIGLIGQAGSGKDTVARMLRDYWVRQHAASVQLAFADPVRDLAATFLRGFGVRDPYRRVNDPELKNIVVDDVSMSPRRIMQTLGTDWAHPNAGRDVWIRSLKIRLHEAVRAGMKHVVISDVRFEVEADWLRSQGGVLWRIDRPGMDPVLEHVSETEMAQIRSHRVIGNDGTLADLERTVGFELARAHYEAGLRWAA
jgi:hypothetical protein